MTLRVEYTGQLRSAIGRSEDRVELPDGATVAALLVHLAEQVSVAARAHLVHQSGQQSGQIQRSLLVAVNGLALAGGQSASVVLQHNDCVVLYPPIGGG